MQKVTKYKCDYCSSMFDNIKECEKHEYRHRCIIMANEMLQNNHSMQEIQTACNIWPSLPEHLKNVTTNSRFIVSHWQCCPDPVYRIVHIDIDGRVELGGHDTTHSYYSNSVDIHYRYLKNPH